MTVADRTLRARWQARGRPMLVLSAPLIGGIDRNDERHAGAVLRTFARNVGSQLTAPQGAKKCLPACAARAFDLIAG